MNQKPYIFDLDISELTKILRSWGQPGYRAQQIWHGLYQSLWSKPKEFTQLSLALREQVAENIEFSHLTPSTRLNSTDGETQKTLFHLPDGHPIETVQMHYQRRQTVCISTQSGCALGCSFCATGQMGLRRNLSSGEIVEQVVYYTRQLAKRGERVTNVVLMGMGEPFHNYESSLEAVRRLNHPQGLNFGARRFTISTVGLVPEIRRFATEGIQANLAISLHAADDELRSSMIPINRKYPLAELMAAVRAYIKATNRRVTFEWALINGINDTIKQAQKLAALTKGMLVHINLIPLNPTKDYHGKASARDRTERFYDTLQKIGVSCTIRLRRGIDIQAGCGQLADLENE